MIQFGYLHRPTLRVFEIIGYYTRTRVTFVVLRDRLGRWYTLTAATQKDGTIILPDVNQPPLPLENRPQYTKLVHKIQMEVKEIDTTGTTTDSA